MGFPGDASGKESACQCSRCKRPGFNPWVGKIVGKDIPLTEEPGRLQSMGLQSWTQLSTCHLQQDIKPRNKSTVCSETLDAKRDDTI